MVKKNYTLRTRRKQLLRILVIAAGGLVLSAILLFFLVLAGVFGRLDSVEELKNIQNYLSSEIYSNEKVLLGKYYYQDRTNVRYEDLPEHLIHALIATEDERFYTHNGIDKKSATRVLVKSILLGDKKSGGGSTLHQQLAKNLFPRKRYSLLTLPVNKTREMITGVRLGKAYSKSEILEFYLNTVSFGENTFGIETASQRFFGTEPGKLRIEESALLVGMLKATHSYNPRNYPERARERRNLVLSRMVKNNFLDQAARDSLAALPVSLRYVKVTHNEGPAPYFREHLRLVLLEWAKNNPREDGTPYNIYTDGLKIYTTINADLQSYAEEAMKAHMAHLQAIFDRQWGAGVPWSDPNSFVLSRLEMTEEYGRLKKQGLSREEILGTMRTPKRMELFTWQGMKEVELSPYDSVIHYEKFLQCGLLSMEATTGYVRAWVGGINSRYFKYDHVSSRRQAGSTFKPVLYAAALNEGRDPCSYIANDSVVYEEYDNWTPRNSGVEYGGYYSMKGALTHSVNTVSVKLLEETGIHEVIEFARQLGMEGEMPEALSLALGTCEASLLEMVKAYSLFMNGGRVAEPVFLKRIEDRNGNVLFEAGPDLSEELLDPFHAQLMTAMMQNVVDEGTASSLRTVYGFTNELAGKTGTTQNYTDGWYIGFSPVLITGVWVGGDLPSVRFRYGGYGQGAYAALPVWARYMQQIYRDPLYRYSRELTFGIPEEVTGELDCEDYIDSPEELKWVERGRWLRNIFKSVRKRRR